MADIRTASRRFVIDNRSETTLSGAIGGFTTWVDVGDQFGPEPSAREASPRTAHELPTSARSFASCISDPVEVGGGADLCGCRSRSDSRGVQAAGSGLASHSDAAMRLTCRACRSSLQRCERVGLFGGRWVGQWRVVTMGRALLEHLPTRQRTSPRLTEGGTDLNRRVIRTAPAHRRRGRRGTKTVRQVALTAVRSRRVKARTAGRPRRVTRPRHRRRAPTSVSWTRSSATRKPGRTLWFDVAPKTRRRVASGGESWPTVTVARVFRR